MKKSYLFMLAITLLLLLSSCTGVSTLNFSDKDLSNTPNLLLNPDFNPYSVVPSESLKGWVVHLDPPGGSESPVIIDPEVHLEGGTCLRIDASDKSVMILSDPFEVRRYGGYYVHTNFKTNSPAPPMIQMRMIVFMENGKILNRFKNRFHLSSDWKNQTISAGFIKPGAKFGRLAYMIPPFKEGSIYIDKAGVYEAHGFKID
jgi:hypothetical protein